MKALLKIEREKGEPSVALFRGQDNNRGRLFINNTLDILNVDGEYFLFVHVDEFDSGIFKYCGTTYGASAGEIMPDWTEKDERGLLKIEIDTSVIPPAAIFDLANGNRHRVRVENISDLTMFKGNHCLKVETFEDNKIYFRYGNTGYETQPGNLFQRSDLVPHKTQITPENMIASEEREVHASGAQRSMDANAYAFDLFNPRAMKRIAKVWAIGAKRYGRNNYERGMPASSCFNHLMNHLFDYLDGDDKEDHLAHMACNIIMAMQSMEMHPHMPANQILRRDNGKLTPEQIRYHDDFKAGLVDVLGNLTEKGQARRKEEEEKERNAMREFEKKFGLYR